MLHINVNEHTEKKGQLTYLSWAWAWAEVLKHDPQATWVVHTYGPQGAEQPCMWIGETAIVHTSVTINGLRRECLLPVMDNKNNAIKLPDARKISDAIMRCMTKAIGMHGLGLYIYAGEDVPQGSDEIKGEVSDVAKLEAKHWATKMQDALDADVDEDIKAMKCFDVHVMIRAKSEVYIAAAEMLPAKMRSAWKEYIKMAEKIGNQSAALR